MVTRRHSSMGLHPLDLPSNLADWFLGIAAVLLVLSGLVHSLLGTADFDVRRLAS
jgi:hypothetical protein